MATKNLATTITIKTADNVTGIFGLDTTVPQSWDFDDTAVSSASVTVASASPTQLVDKTVANTKTRYVYIKNTDTTNFIFLKNDDAVTFGKLEAGKWAFFPTYPSLGLEVQADTADIVIEYAIFRAP